MRLYSSTEMILDMSRTTAMALKASVTFIFRDRRNSCNQFFSFTNIANAKIGKFSHSLYAY